MFLYTNIFIKTRETIHNSLYHPQTDKKETVYTSGVLSHLSIGCTLTLVLAKSADGPLCDVGLKPDFRKANLYKKGAHSFELSKLSSEVAS